MSRRSTGSAASRVQSSGERKQDKQTTNGDHPKRNKNEESAPTGSHLDYEDEDDDGPIRAPVQLKLEFVNSIMFRQWELAKKLCQFMLMYEPNNDMAKQYAPLIEFMLTKEESSSSEDDDDGDDDENGKQTDDDDASVSSSSSSSSEEEKRQPNQVDFQSPKPVNASLSKQLKR